MPYVKAGIPVVHLPTLEWQDGRRGFVGHEETEQGLRDGKSDPGPPFDWAKFINMLKAETEEEMPTPAELFAALKTNPDFAAYLTLIKQVEAAQKTLGAQLGTHVAIPHAGAKHKHPLSATISGATEEN